MNQFLFQLGDEVVIECSGEFGVVIGRAEYQTMSDSYLIRYKCADGRAVEAWWCVDALRHRY